MVFAPKRILCPIDLSPISSLVLGWASLFAEEYGAEVTILHADLFFPPLYFTQSQVAELIDTREEARRTLRRSLAELAEDVLDQGVSREILVEDTHPLVAILAWVRERRPDLVVMGSHGRSGVSRLLLGSVSENVMRHVFCPTLIVRGKDNDGETLRVERMLCPVSLTGHDRECVDVSSSIAARFGAELFLLHVVEESDRELAQVRENLCTRVNEWIRASGAISEGVRQGNAAEQIVQWVREHEAELVVLGASHRPLLEGTILGTTTERVARHCPSPVLIVPV